MANRKKIMDIIDRKHQGVCGFWKGRPHKEALSIYLNDLQLKNEEELSSFVGDDLMWSNADSSYKDPEGKPVFDTLLGKKRVSNCEQGIFHDTTEVSEVHNFPWPDIKHINLDDYIEIIKKARADNYAVFGGFWSPFFHIAADFFGMEEYFIKMYTDPEVVLAVTEHIVEYFYQANKLLFEKASQYIDVFFFGNDFGTQLDLLISPEMFKKFVYPGTKRLVDLAKSYDLKVALHSCGSIYKVIPLLIDTGVDVIHPIQAKAVNMNAEILMKKFGEKVVFMGGVDTQDLLPFGSEQEVEQEVKRLMKVFGSNYIVSPSHEALLKNVTTKNLIAMARSVK